MAYNFDTKEMRNTKSCIMDMFCLLETQHTVLIRRVIKTSTLIPALKQTAVFLIHTIQCCHHR